MKLDQMSSGSSSLLDPLYHTDPTNTSYMVSHFIMFDILDIFCADMVKMLKERINNRDNSFGKSNGKHVYR